MNELSSEFSLGVTLEAALQESRNQTVLLSDLRDNSEARKKTDEKTFEQLRRLQQATTQSLEIAKTQKRQSKDDSTTLKTMHESTSKENAIIARKQTSTLSLLTSTVNTGLNVVNQKMFIALESLGQSLTNAFSAVGRSIENKLYSFMGSFSVLIKPIVGIVKVGFSVMTKLISVQLKLIWSGLKAFSKTLFGKIVMLGTTLLGAYYFITKTDIGAKIYTVLSKWATEKMNNPNSTIGKVLKTLNFIWDTVKIIALAVGVKKLVGVVKDAKTAINWIRSTKPVATTVANTAKPVANSVAGFPGVWNGINTAERAASAGTNATTVAKTGKLASIGGKALKYGKYLGKGFNPLGIAAGIGVDYLADKVENKTAKGLLNVGSAALTGASTGAMIGSIIPGVGTVIGGAIGGLIGGGASLLSGEGGKFLFGKNENNNDNEVRQLEQMSKRQDQSQNAQIRAMDNIAEAIKESNKTMTKVIDKQNIDAQFATTRTDTFLNEQNRHADAVATNEKLDKIRDEFVKLTAAFTSLANNMSRQYSNSSSSLSIQPNIA